ncbi:MAG: hypothetical protein LBE24_00565 [Methylobacillus sp.]|jgi:hypothetical protein|nr:hypothetical protein [Methylobacillus sp.]
MKSSLRDWFVPNRRTLIQIFWVLLLAFFFANVEIQIEGSAGWAANLPTWRIPNNWWLDTFFGGREMTGYHAWIFSCVALFFHWPVLFNGHWTWRIEARLIGCTILFWLVEDFLWFVLNPAYGLEKFDPVHVPWHIHWFAFVPVDYWTMSVSVLALFFISRSHIKES